MGILNTPRISPLLHFHSLCHLSRSSVLFWPYLLASTEYVCCCLPFAHDVWQITLRFWQSCLPGFYHPLSSFLRIFISSSQRHLKRAMNICFYFALRVSTLIFRVLNIGKEHYPIRTLIELTIISKIYNLKPNIFLMLITRTTLPECVWVYAIHIYVFKTTIWR